jgi:5-hydroxyisourate hydrolase-like protein (transthyretin family)
MRTLLIAAALVAAAAAQESAKSTGSISGVVKDVTTGTPQAEVTVFVRGSASQTKAVTDSDGRYALRGLAPGSYQVNASAFKSSRVWTAKNVTLSAGQDLTAIDFALRTFGEISGKVLDENKEPVPGMMVLLVAREYRLGTLEYVYAGAAYTNDQGAYRLERVTPGRAFLLVVQRAFGRLRAVSDAPPEPKLRRKVFPSTYYPGSTFLDGAQPLFLRSGERREGVDFQLARVPSFCIEGILDTGNGPTGLSLRIGPQRPASGRSGGGGFYVGPSFAETGPDGKIRICELSPGDYQLTVWQRAAKSGECPPFFGIAQASITDRDVRNFRVDARPRIPIPGEVVWDGAPPGNPVESKLSVELRPLTRTPFMGEDVMNKSAIPGEFSYPWVLLDEYLLRFRDLPEGLYVKDITYAGTSILRCPLRAGSAIGNATLRITLARDGGVVNAKVADKDGNPVPGSYVLIAPVEANTEAALAAALITGQTDQKGAYTTSALAPGKYYVMASTTPTDMSPECIGKLFQARSRAQEVVLGPNANVTVTLAPTL